MTPKKPRREEAPWEASKETSPSQPDRRHPSAPPTSLPGKTPSSQEET